MAAYLHGLDPLLAELLKKVGVDPKHVRKATLQWLPNDLTTLHLECFVEADVVKDLGKFVLRSYRLHLMDEMAIEE